MSTHTELAAEVAALRALVLRQNEALIEVLAWIESSTERETRQELEMLGLEVRGAG